MSFIPPSGYNRIKIVNSFEELVATPMGPKVNAICWSRRLDGNFNELADLFKKEDEITSLDEEMLSDLRSKMSYAGQQAVDTLLNDFRLMLEHGLSPSLECVPFYQRDEAPGPIATDVYSFHVDRAPVMTDTFLCSYNGPATEALRNDQAQRRIDVPATRAELLRLFEQEGSADDFETHFKENCYDLHYAAINNATPFSFGIGNLWRIAVEYPGSPVPACVHRAPATPPGQLPRLLLIS